MNQFPEFIQTLPEVDLPFDGVSGWLLQGDTRQVVFLQCHQLTDVPAHSHRSQWELVIDGEVELHMEGKTQVHRAGDSFYIPEGIEHGATIQPGYKAIVFFDQTDRYQTRS
jgi:mannose-6-phosphate isomerase-like protein (cupin superfamily)